MCVCTYGRSSLESVVHDDGSVVSVPRHNDVTIYHDGADVRATQPERHVLIGI